MNDIIVGAHLCLYTCWNKRDVWIKSFAILKPIWAYGVQLWGAASNSNIEILQRFQIIVNVSNDALHRTILTYHTKLETRLKDSARDTSLARRNIPTYSRLTKEVKTTD